MILIVGGQSQGKLAHALRLAGCGAGAVCDGAGCPLCPIPPDTRILNQLHLFVYRQLQAGRDARQIARVLDAWLSAVPDAVIISNEIGCGIVPMDAFERAWRECTGRLLCSLAARAQRVDRVICGVAQALRCTAPPDGARPARADKAESFAAGRPPDTAASEWEGD